MVDTWATVGSCAQIGKNVHISGGVGIGGVLEPLQANPTIIEDDCFIGARSEVAEGVIVREGAVLAMGMFIGQSTKIVDRETGETVTAAKCRPMRSSCRRAARPANGGPVARVRRDRQARRRADAREDRHQRVAARLIEPGTFPARPMYRWAVFCRPPEVWAWTGPGTCSALTAA